MKPGGTIGFAVVGTGQMAATMAHCLSLSPRIKVVAVASPDAARAAAFAGDLQTGAVHGTLAEVLTRADVDAVYIANATRDHAATAIAALAAGKAVLCEKPFALDEAQGRQVAAAAAQHGRLFMEAQWTPFLPAFRALQRQVDDGSLGTPQHLYSDFGYVLDADDHPRLFKGVGAGVLLDFGVYPIVFARQLLGPVVSVRAAIRYNAAGVDVQAALQLVHRGGATSQLAASLVASMPNASHVDFSHGTARLDSPVMGADWLSIRRTTPSRSVRRPSGPPGAKDQLVELLKRQPWLRRLKAASASGTRTDHPFGADRYLPQLLHFIDLLDRGAIASEVMPVARSLEVLRVIDLARADCPPPAATP